ncbi:MAG TPA: bifunctional [glutamine synthetase] adenylyltransferase/[glutamine synthetase]-adenylyl-L-tyrosine phosphorylase, partial [Actinocrinis sp.]|uniref:bifunctional [glutamine synthetase] adenylyltransferase/[glutamine synthetase]-adenylyl-L-tyrosine phosphorylase n=1 Tax=Actinocrinis sp. TaxID=1920516 RepID=UPI002DDD0418
MALDRERESKVSLLARRGFVDPAAAAAILASPAFGELGRDPMATEALGRCADPDLALGSLASLLEASPEPGLLRATLASSKPLRDRLFGVLGVSDALGAFLVRHPDSWHVLEEFDVEDLAPGAGRFSALMLGAVGATPPEPPCGLADVDLDDPIAAVSDADADGGEAPDVPHALHAPVSPPVATLTGQEAADALRIAYRRALLAVTARDVAAGTDLTTVAADLADLAGATLEAALAVARAEEPEGVAPCRLAVIGMGKCGARELNYVSDVDVVFVAEPVRPGEGIGGAGEVPATQVDETEALRTATRLASRMMRLCSESTPEGSIWQVDAALRPEGRSGPLVRTLASHTAYYQRWAKTWEFQALLKARPVAGDVALGAEYVAMTTPLVWSAVARDNFVDDVQAMRRRVVSHATDSLRRAPGSVAVDRELKLGPGGLRDVEFAVQLLQLVHGRGDETLRARSTLDALDALAKGGYVGREDAAHLAEAYRFLRAVEHRIQLFRLERTHTMPDDPSALRRIGRSMGCMVDPAGELRTVWQRHAREVRRLHEKLFYRPLLSSVARLDDTSAAVPSVVGPRPRLSREAARSRLAALGYADPAGALINIEALATGVSRRAAIQRTLLPVMLGWFADAPDPDAGLLAFRRVSDALGSTPWYLRSLRDEGEAAWRLARVLSSGGYAPDLLMRAPEAVALLSDDKALVVRERGAIEAEMMALVCRADSAESAVAAVRGVRRRELFRIVATDLLGMLGGDDGADPLDVLGRALTDVTAATIEAALAAVVAFRGAGSTDGGDEVEGRRPVPLPGEPCGGTPAHRAAREVEARQAQARIGGGLGEAAEGDAVVGVGGGHGEGAPYDVLSEGRAHVAANGDADADADAAEARDRAAVPAQERAVASNGLPTRLAVIAMGRFGGAELGYGSDADVMFVHEPREGADEQRATAVAFEIANELRRLLQLPTADPPLVIDADLRPEGRQGPLVRSLASYAEYYKRWSRVWEAQALLRATPVAGDAVVGKRFVRLIDPIRYPVGGVAEADLREIRRLKARMEAERLPRGADRSLHTKLGPGGLSDVEWVAQLIQLRHGAEFAELRTTATRAVLAAAVAYELLGEDDRALLDDAWCETTRLRNGITIVRGRPADQLPTAARSLAGIANYLGVWDERSMSGAGVGRSGSVSGSGVSGHGASGAGSAGQSRAGSGAGGHG